MYLGRDGGGALCSVFRAGRRGSLCRGVFRAGRRGALCRGVFRAGWRVALCRGVFRGGGHCAGVYLGGAEGGIVQGCI